jgi:hypothetical protein
VCFRSFGDSGWAMKRIFDSFDFPQVGHYQSILEAAGIRTLVKNLGVSNAHGAIPMTEVYPELWVVDDEDFDEAMELLESFHGKESEEQDLADWVCGTCGEQVPGSLGECWNCQGESV